MSYDIPRPVVRAIQLSPQHRAAVSDADLHGVCHGAFRLSRDVDRRPGKSQCRGGVDPPCGEERAHVGDARARLGVGVGQEDDIADYGEGRGGDDEDGAFVQALGVDGDGERGDESEGVWGDGEQLRVGGGVAKVFDDSRQEETKGVQGQGHGVEGKAVEPALRVAQGLEHVGPGEGLVMRGVGVAGEPVADELALGVGEELGRVGVVVDEEVGRYGDYDGRETFEDEDPVPAVFPAADPFHVADALDRISRWD